MLCFSLPEPESSMGGVPISDTDLEIPLEEMVNLILRDTHFSVIMLVNYWGFFFPEYLQPLEKKSF